MYHEPYGSRVMTVYNIWLVLFATVHSLNVVEIVGLQLLPLQFKRIGD